MPAGSPLLDALKARGLLYQCTDGLDAHLAGGPRTVYCGFDPTAASLHVGNLVQLVALSRLADAGHRVIALVGGGTAMIGDPSGKSVERPLLGVEDVIANSAAIEAQIRRVLGGRVTLVDNASWLRELRTIDFLRDVGKHFPINQMLAKDSVKSRLDAGISYTEFSYMLLQAYDFLQLFKRHGVSIQMGGSDQWGNITAGTELIRRSAGGEAHALTTPLLTTASGKKFGKTEAGAVWLKDDAKSVFEFYQFWVNTDDADVPAMLKIFTSLPEAELAALAQETTNHPERRAAQRALADAVTTLVHGADALRRAKGASEILFTRGSDYTSFADDALALAREMSGGKTIRFTGGATPLADVVAEVFDVSKSEVRRLQSQGGLSVNGAKIAEGTTELSRDAAIRGRWFVIKRGGQKVAVVDVAG